MIVLGLICLVLGFVLSAPVLWTIGIGAIAAGNATITTTPTPAALTRAPSRSRFLPVPSTMSVRTRRSTNATRRSPAAEYRMRTVELAITFLARSPPANRFYRKSSASGGKRWAATWRCDVAAGLGVY
jgi:hypothetical protein